ncbi:MAG: inositol monophosphatase family protein [Candidatus Omnitrophota bacterium]
MNKEIKAAMNAAIAAGKFIKSRKGKHKSIRYKGDINIVTDVDEKAEELIVRSLKKSFPEYGILAEERPAEEKSSGRWIIDPIDGTTNFAHSFPFFTVSIALEREAEVILGVVYDPMHEELFTVRKGKGSYLNGKRIFVSQERSLSKAFLATGFSYGFREHKDNNISNFEKFLNVSLAVRRAGAASLDLCYVACGRFDGFWESDLCPWDTAAATLLVSEAGGKVTDFIGKKFSNYKTQTLASNGKIHRQMMKVLNCCR